MGQWFSGYFELLINLLSFFRRNGRHLMILPVQQIWLVMKAYSLRLAYSLVCL